MTQTDLEVLHYLAGLRSGNRVRARLIASILGLPTNRKGIWLMRLRLGRLKKQGLVSDYKAHPDCERKYWYITDKGRSELQRALEAISAVKTAAQKRLKQMSSQQPTF
jgi:Transcriptional regulator PadR-like family